MADLDVNRRLKYLIEEIYKISALSFSSKYNDKGGVKTSQILRERNGVSSKMIELILSAYPEINRTWLLTGEGEMFKKKEQKKQIDNNSENITIPREVFDLMVSQQKTIESQQKTIENQSKKTNAEDVKGVVRLDDID